MKERPILFSGEMVRALLAGRKTQTRRIITDRREWAAKALPKLTALVPEGAGFSMRVGYGGDPLAGHVGMTWCPYGGPGDRLWVRETWGIRDATSGAQLVPGNLLGRQPTGTRIVYRADADGPEMQSWWAPSIHMPRWASRLTLDVVSVRAERLHAITEDDARAEGVEPEPCGCCERLEACEVGANGGRCCTCCLGTGVGESFASAYANLWDAINGARGPWASNPWVWVLTFHRIEAP